MRSVFVHEDAPRSAPASMPPLFGTLSQRPHRGTE